MSYLRDYIVDKTFRFTYTENKLDIINYIEINYMEDSKISLLYSQGIFVVKGENLRIQKLLDNEILVVGKIENIEFKDWYYESIWD